MAEDEVEVPQKMEVMMRMKDREISHLLHVIIVKRKAIILMNVT